MNAGNAVGLDPLSLRFYYLDAGNANPEISYLDPVTSTHTNTGVVIPATAELPGFGFNVSGLGYVISNSGDLYSITTNYTGTDIPGVNLLGNIGAATVGDLAVDNDGFIWAVLNSNELYKIDPTLAIPTSKLVGTLSEATNFAANAIESVAFAATGELLVGAGSNIYEVDIATAQATLIGNIGANSYDFASCTFPTFTTDLEVVKTLAQTGTAAPGDTLDYTITVSNTGSIIITGTILTDTIPDGISYITGSTTVNGSTISDISGQMPFINGGEINSSGFSNGSIVSGIDVIITFRVLVDCCPGTATISNQAAVDFDGAASAVLSDDPALPGATDPTDIPVSILAAPVITNAATNQTIQCNTATNTTSLTDWLNTNGGATATVACGLVNWTNDFSGLTNTCGGTGSATVIFTATNDCGLSVSTTANFTIEDTTPPDWTTNPADITIECNGTADPRGEVTNWLTNNGGGVVSDSCGAVAVTNDYTVLTTIGCSGTGNATVTFTATDECGLTSSRSAVLTIVDSTAPEWTTISDITVDCDNIPAPVNPTATDSCDTNVDIVYNEVKVYHPGINWKGTGSCSLIHTISAASHDDKGTPADSSDDEMTFTLTVIGQNEGSGWSATVNGTSISGEYYKTYEFGPLLSNGSILNFSIIDNTDASCITPVEIDMINF